MLLLETYDIRIIKSWSSPDLARSPDPGGKQQYVAWSMAKDIKYFATFIHALLR